jgi:hypothetical protein
MLTELFLLTVVICTAFVKQTEAFPALVYCAVSYLFYFIATSLDEKYVYHVAGLAEVLLIVLLSCVHGCVKSHLTRWLIPLSVLAIVMHFYGWTLYIHKHSPDVYNNLVVTYWLVVLGLFLGVGRWNGSRDWNIRFFNNSHSRNSIVAEVSKE